MHNIRRGLTVAAVVVAAVGVATAGVVYNSSRDSKGTSVAAQEEGIRVSPESASSGLRPVLLSGTEQPTGTKFHEYSFQQAAAAKAFYVEEAGGIAVKPDSCVNYLRPVLGDPSTVAGWFQIGMRTKSEASEGGRFSALVAKIPGGANLDKIRENVATCKSGTMTLKSVGVTGTITLKEHRAPAITGAKTFGLAATVTFPKTVSAADISAAAGCQIPMEPTVDGVTLASVPCATTPQGYSMTHYFVYVADGDTLIESCEAQAEFANQMAVKLHDRAKLAS